MTHFFDSSLRLLRQQLQRKRLVIAGLCICTAMLPSLAMAAVSHSETQDASRASEGVHTAKYNLALGDTRLAMAQQAYTQFASTLTSGAVPETDDSWRSFLGLDVGLGEAYLNAGMEQYRQGNYFQAAELLALAHDFRPDDTTLTGQLGFAYKETGAYEKAHALLLEATEKDAENYYVWWWLSDTQRLLGEYENAVESMSTARDLAPAAQAKNLQSYVDFTQRMADPERSWESVNAHVDFAKRHAKLRRIERATAEYFAALEHVPEFEVGNSQGTARVGWLHQQLGIQYDYVKEPRIALYHYRQAIQHFEQMGSQGDVMRNYQNLALSYRRLAERTLPMDATCLEKSVAAWDASLKIARDLKDIEYERYLLGGKLITLSCQLPVDAPEVQELREAIRLEIPRQGPVGEYTVAEAVVAEATCRLKEGDWAGARILFEMALPHYDASTYLTDSERLATLYTHLSYVYYRQKHYERALEMADKAEEALDSVRQFMTSAAFNKSNNSRALRHICAARIRAALALEDFSQVLTVVEEYSQQLRSDMFALLQEEAGKLDQATEAALLPNRIVRLEEALQRTLGERDSEASTFIEQCLKEDQARLIFLERGVKFDAALLKTATTTSLEGLATDFPEDSTVVNYLVDEWGAVAVLTSRAGVQGLVLENVDEAALCQKMVFFHELREAGDTAQPVLQHFYQVLIAPLFSKLKTEKLYIATDEVLAGAPFDAFLDADGKALLDQFLIAHTSSPGALLATQGNNAIASSTALSVIAGHGKEGVAFFPASAAPTVYADAEATESNAMAAAQRGDMLYLDVDVDTSLTDPILAALLLQADGKQDGRLYVAELLDAAFASDFVTLYAHYGEVVAPSVVLAALSEGFQQAGVNAFLFNQWNMADQAAQTLLQSFYTNLLAGQDALHALVAAKRALRDAAPTQYDWAAFSLFGVR